MGTNGKQNFLCGIFQLSLIDLARKARHAATIEMAATSGQLRYVSHGDKMKLFIRAIVVIAVIWLAMLFTGYGVLTGSNKNAAGLGLQCSYLTARGMITAQYLHTDSGIVGVTDCPLLKKSGEVVDN
jgi:hypothetical protein